MLRLSKARYPRPQTPIITIYGRITLDSTPFIGSISTLEDRYLAVGRVTQEDLSALREESLSGRKLLAHSLRAEAETVDDLRREMGAAREEYREQIARLSRQIAAERQNQADYQIELLALTRGELATSTESLSLTRSRIDALVEEVASSTQRLSPAVANYYHIWTYNPRFYSLGSLPRSPRA